jgi:protein tyrosine/serine phosphatase
VNFIRLTPNGAEKWLDQMTVGFLSVMDDPTHYPVLVHCFAGRDRTGTMCAIYRMEYEGWPSSLAASEMGHFGFDPAKDDVAKSYEQYVMKYRTRRQRIE